MFLFSPKTISRDDAAIKDPVDQEKDVATAILRKKPAPNKLMVDDATNDDNSIISMSNTTMEKLGLFRGDTILVKGKKRRDTVLIVLADDTCEDTKVRINKGTINTVVIASGAEEFAGAIERHCGSASLPRHQIWHTRPGPADR